MRKAIGKVALFMMIGRSSSWQIFLVPMPEKSWHREIRIFYVRYSEF
jgi:hypothetical protein